MSRSPLRFGYRLSLFVPQHGGFLTLTHSALAPLGVRPSPVSSDGESTGSGQFERAVFVLCPGDDSSTGGGGGGSNDADGDFRIGEEVHFGQVVRIVHSTQHTAISQLLNEHAVLDKTAQKVTIMKSSDDNGGSSLYCSDRWRVLPRYKVRGEGDRVCEGDHILLQSTLTTDLYLSVSTQRDDRTDKCFEVQCDDKAECLQVRFYDADMDEENSNGVRDFIRGGQCVMLLHRELNRFFRATTKTAPPGKKEHMCVLDVPESSTHSLDPLVGNNTNFETLFILEGADQKRAGMVQFAPKEKYRIKTVGSSHYLAVDTSLQQFVLIPGSDEESSTCFATLFSLHCAEDTTDDFLVNGGKAYLEVHSSQPKTFWVGASSLGGVSKSTFFDEQQQGEAPQYLPLAAKHACGPSDAIEIRRLPFSEYREINNVLVLLPPLRTFAGALSIGAVDSGMLTQVVANIQELKRICFRDTGALLMGNGSEVDGVVDRRGQGRLQQQGVAQAVMDVVSGVLSSDYIDKKLLTSAEDVTTFQAQAQLVLDGAASVAMMQQDPVRYSDLLDLVNLCVSVVQFIVRDNVVTANALRPMLPTLLRCCADVPGAASCIAEFLRGNSTLLNEISEEGDCDDLNVLLDLLWQRPRDAELVNLIGLFAANRDEGFSQAQKVIGTRLLNNPEWRDRILMKCICDKKSDNKSRTLVELSEVFMTEKQQRDLPLSRIIAATSPNEKDERLFFVPLSEIPALRMRAKLKGKPSPVPLIASQLSLLAAMCAGRDGMVMENLEHIIQKRVVIDALDDDSLPPIIHAGFLQLFSSAIVIVPNTINIFDDLASVRFAIDGRMHLADEPLKLTEKPEDVDPDLSRAAAYARTVLVDGGGNMSSDEGKREELDAVVRLTASILSRGCIPLTDFDAIMYALTAFLDRRNDAASNDPEVFRDKVTIIRLLHQFTDLAVMHTVSSMLRNFATCQREASNDPLLASTEANVMDVEVSQLLDPSPYTTFSADFFARQKEADVFEEEANAKKSSNPLRVASASSSETSGAEVVAQSKQRIAFLKYLLEVLEDIALVENWPLRSSAIQLFCRITNQAAAVAEGLRRVYVTNNENNDMYDKLAGVASELNRYRTTPKHAYRVVQALKVVTDLVSQGSSLTPRGMSTGSSSASATPRLIQEAIAMCKHLKIHSSLMAILARLEIIRSKTSDSALGEMCRVGLETLSALSAGFPTFLNDTCDNMNSIVFLARVCPMEYIKLCRTVFPSKSCIFKLTPECTAELVGMIVNRAKSHELTAEAISVLRTILSVKDKGGRYISKNQMLVWKAILQSPDVSQLIRVSGSWTGSRAIERRTKLLSSTEVEDSNAVALHLAVLDMIFMVMKQNDTLKPEEVRYEMFGAAAVDEILEVVSNVALDPSFRYPYVNLLQVLFIEDPVGLASIFAHKLLQPFLQLCIADITRISGVVAEISATSPPNPEENVGNQKNNVTIIGEDVEQSLRFHGTLLCLAILPCVRHLMVRFSQAAGKVHPKVRLALTSALNDIVEATVEFSIKCTGSSDGGASDKAAAAQHLDTVAMAIFPSDTIALKKLIDFMNDAVANEFVGNSPAIQTGIPACVERLRQLKSRQAAMISVDAGERSSVLGGSVGDQQKQFASPSSLWTALVDAFEARVKVSEPNTFAAGAGAILRNGRPGTEFVKVLISSLTFLDAANVANVMQLLQQVVRLEKNDPHDCSEMLEIEEHDADDHTLSLDLSIEERQSRLAAFDSVAASKQILPMVAELIASPNQHLRTAALRCAIVLLDGGHRAMQEVLYRSVEERIDESIFVHLRDELSLVREELLTYIRAISRGTEPHGVLEHLPEITELLRFAQLTCEGHYSAMQNYLRTQPNNVVSVNIMEAMCSVLSVVCRCVDEHTVEFLIQLLATICEALQGPCRHNQDSCVAAGVAEKLVALVSMTDEVSSEQETSSVWRLSPADKQSMKLSAIRCMLALIEGRGEKDYLSRLLSTISIKKLCATMERCVEEYETKHGSLDSSRISVKSLWTTLTGYFRPKANIHLFGEHLNDQLAVAVDVFVFLRSFLDHQSLIQTAESSHYEFVDANGNTIKRSLRRAASFLSVNGKVGMVEIVRDGQLERCYFRILDQARRNLLTSSCDNLIKNVDRGSDMKKLQSFLEIGEQIILEMNFYHKLRSMPIIPLFSDLDATLDVLGLVWALLINVFMLSVAVESPNAFDTGLGVNDETLDSIGKVSIGIQALLLINYFVGPARLHFSAVAAEWTSKEELADVEARREQLNIEVDSDRKSKDGGIVEWVYESVIYGVYLVVNNLFHGPFIQRALYLVASVLGVWQSRIWFTIQLLRVINHSQLLYNVLLAITINGSSLLLTLLLALIVIYIFSAISFYHFTEFFDPNRLGYGYDCRSLSSCWYMHIEAIRSGGGIGDVTSNPNFDPQNTSGYYFAAFKLVFFVVVIIIFLNIIFGIIVDSFGQLRDERDAVEQDQVSKCFICGIEQNEFDRLRAGGFMEHTKSQHNMWHYLFFIHYLQKKDPEDYTGQEAFVAHRLAARDISFFPVGQAMMLKTLAEPVDESADNGSIAKSVAQVNNNVAELRSLVLKLEQQIERLGK